MPEIDFVLLPGDSLELTLNIKISPLKTENCVELYAFEFYTDKHGQFGEILEATVEIVPKDMKQEDALMHILQDENVDEKDPEVIKVATEMMNEGLGSLEECIQSVMRSRKNFSDSN